MTRPASGPLFCTRGQHWASRERFRLRAPGRFHSWCIDCKRAYDRIELAQKRAAPRTAPNPSPQISASHEAI